MEAISQIIRSVGLFVSSSPEVTITKNQPFLCILKNGSIEVPDFVYSLPNCWMLCYWFCDETSQFELENYFYSSFLLKITIFLHCAWAEFRSRNLIICARPFLCAKSNLNHFRQTPPSMKAISQIIRYVGLFVSSSPEVTISTKNQPFLYNLKDGSIEVPDFVYSLPNFWEML